MSQQIIDTISLLDDDASSLQRLANVVLREYSLTISVVRTANSAHYRRTGRPIQSATHAMLMLGARTVRQLASSLLLFENYARRSDQLKELMLLSLLTANHARETVAKLGMGDPEEAHLCGMFRNLGEVLVACHFPEDYNAIQAAIREHRVTPSGAANAVLGFRFEELGVALSKHWGMPESVMTGMCARALSPLSEMGGITSFSHDLTRAIYRSGDHKADSQQALNEVIALYAPRLKLSRAAVIEIVEAALAETRELFSNATAEQGAALRKLASSARAALGEPAMNTGEWNAMSLMAPAGDAMLLLREKLRQELENKVEVSSEATLAGVILLALEGALRGAPFDRVIACVLSADRTQLTARSALGVGAEELMPKFDFPMSARGGPVATALLQRQPVYLPFDRLMTAQETRWANGIGCAQFGVFPIIVEMRIVGCLYADCASVHPLPDRGTILYVKSLCELVARAIAARRGLSPSVTPAQVLSSVPGADHSSSETNVIFPGVPAAWSASLAASRIAGVHTPQSKAALVLRVLQGADPVALAESARIKVSELEQWRDEFLAGALSRMG